MPVDVGVATARRRFFIIILVVVFSIDFHAAALRQKQKFGSFKKAKLCLKRSIFFVPSNPVSFICFVLLNHFLHYFSFCLQAPERM